MCRLPNSIQLASALIGAVASFYLSASDLMQSEVLVQNLLISQGPEHRERVPVLRVGPINVEKHDLFDVRFQLGVTTESETPIMIGREIRMCDRISTGCGHIVLPSLATNIDRRRHHEIIDGAILFQSPIAIKNGYLTLYLWANSQSPGKSVEMEKGGAVMQILRVADTD